MPLLEVGSPFVFLQHRIDVNNVQLAQLLSYIGRLIQNQASPSFLFKKN